MKALKIDNTATDLTTVELPFQPNNTVVIANHTGGSLTIQDSDDDSTYGTLATVTDIYTVVNLRKQYIKVSTSANAYLLQN